MFLLFPNNFPLFEDDQQYIIVNFVKHQSAMQSSKLQMSYSLIPQHILFSVNVVSTMITFSLTCGHVLTEVVIPKMLNLN